MRRLRLTVAAMGASLLLAGCGSSDEGTASPSAEARTTTSAAPPPEEVSPLEGTWQTSSISASDVEATLRRYGLAKWIERFQPVSPLGAEQVLILRIGDDWDLFVKPTGKSLQKVDYDADYDVYGSKVDKIHATGATTYRWTVDGDKLKFEWLMSTEPAFRGIPDEVFSRALYMTQEFTKQS